MIVERITRDERQIPRVSFSITEKGLAALHVFEGW
jgi:DNA-binding HxlR family transcriptional regulator